MMITEVYPATPIDIVDQFILKILLDVKFCNKSIEVVMNKKKYSFQLIFDLKIILNADCCYSNGSLTLCSFVSNDDFADFVHKTSNSITYTH